MIFLLWISAVSSGLLGGLALALATVVPDGLAKLQTDLAQEAMDTMLSALGRSVFAILFFAATLSCLLLLFLTVPRLLEEVFSNPEGPDADHVFYTVMGSAFFLTGVTLTTLTGQQRLLRFLNYLASQVGREDEAAARGMSRRIWEILNITQALACIATMLSFMHVLITP
jgi:uncharacterized membrane protein